MFSPASLGSHAASSFNVTTLHPVPLSFASSKSYRTFFFLISFFKFNSQKFDEMFLDISWKCTSCHQMMPKFCWFFINRLQTKCVQWSDMSTSSSTTAVKKRVAINFLVCQTAAVVAVDQRGKPLNGAVWRLFIDTSRRAVQLDGFLSCCFAHMLKCQERFVCQGLILKMLDLCCFPRLVIPSVSSEGKQ